VIATAGRAASLDRTLQSLRQLRYPLFEVIVVLGPSLDNSAEIVARHADFIRHYPIDRLNLSAARNIGVAMAQGDVVAFIDDDAMPEPDWLDRLITGYEDPRVAQVGGFIRDNRGVDFQCKYLVVDRFGDSVGFDELPELDDDSHFLGLTGTNFSVRRDLLTQMGGFDEEYAYFLDETDVTIRLVDRGWASSILPDAEVHHKFEPSHLRTVMRVPKSMYATARSKAYFCCVHNRDRRPLHEILDYLANFIRRERDWKTNLFRYGHADRETVERLIEEVERGARDGVRDAFFHLEPQAMPAELVVAARQARFRQFPLQTGAADRLRICFLSQDYPPLGNGGIGQWTREMATGLAKRGHEVTVICRSETDYPYIDFIDGVWVHRITTQSSPADEAAEENVPLALLSYSASVEAEIQRVQARRQFQVVCGPIFDLEPLVTLRRSGIPTVISLQTTYGLALPHKPDWRDSAWYRRSHVDKVIAKEKDLLRTAPFMLANTPGLVADLEAGYDVPLTPDRVTIISHGIEDLAANVPLSSADASDNARGLRLLFVGRLELRKGADILLEALPGLLRQHPQLEVDIVGDDNIDVKGETLRHRFEKVWLRDQVEAARVTFHGVVLREELLRHYARCDIFVAPSRYESFGLIYIEAMAFSKPVIGLAVGGVTDVVADGVSGLLVKGDNPALLSSAVSRLIEDAPMRIEMGRAGRRIYEQRFNIERMLDASEAYFRAIAGTERPRKG
jgi:glycosyltransferase involved in cell wall biosynthesis